MTQMKTNYYNYEYIGKNYRILHDYLRIHYEEIVEVEVMIPNKLHHEL